MSDVSSIRYDIGFGARLVKSLPVILFFLGIAVVLAMFIPSGTKGMSLQNFAALGLIGLWRYAWLITHYVRAMIFEHFRYGKLCFESRRLSDEEKYPDQLFFIIPTFQEKPDVSRRMLQSVMSEARTVTSKVIVLVNAASDEEDDLFREVIAEDPTSEIELMFVRQQGGKRRGMADALFALRTSEYTIGKEDIVVLMDGDTVLGKKILEKSLPFFATNPRLGAVTTDNIAVTSGNAMYRKWYTLRFAMRHRMMKSISLSNQLLVLTGRFSVFRAQWCLTDDFIAHVENDRISHWLHGEIKFITGDDKSTWYSLLKEGWEMLYVADAHIYCMEDSGPEPFRQSILKMKRWFGNMLRNNGRAIRLGVGAQKPFVWWCVIDQRISMWTSLLGPVTAIWAAIFISPYYLVLYAIIVIVVRVFYLILLTTEGHRMSFTDLPLLLYTQWVGSIVKIHGLFHLHRQGWDAHRRKKGEKNGNEESLIVWLIPKLEIVFSFALLILFVAWLVGFE